MLCWDGPVRLLHSHGSTQNHSYPYLCSSILIPAFKHDEWKPFIATSRQTWIGASNNVGPSTQQPVFYATPAPQQWIYAVQPPQQQYSPVGMMQVPVQGGYIQGHFVPTTAIQPQPGPTAQPASGTGRPSTYSTQVSGTPVLGSIPNMA